MSYETSEQETRRLLDSPDATEQELGRHPVTFTRSPAGVALVTPPTIMGGITVIPVNHLVGKLLHHDGAQVRTGAWVCDVGHRGSTTKAVVADTVIRRSTPAEEAPHA